MRSINKTRLTTIALAALACTGIAGPASASGGNPGVTASGSCSATSVWTLQAKPREGGLEIEFEVDSNVNGQVWTVAITDNGARLFKGKQTTLAPSGSFDVTVHGPNQAGPDKILARASNPATGETCVGRVTHP